MTPTGTAQGQTEKGPQKAIGQLDTGRCFVQHFSINRHSRNSISKSDTKRTRRFKTNPLIQTFISISSNCWNMFLDVLVLFM